MRLSNSTTATQLVSERGLGKPARTNANVPDCDQCFSTTHAVRPEQNLKTEVSPTPEQILEVSWNWQNNFAHAWPPSSSYVPLLMALALLDYMWVFLQISDLEFAMEMTQQGHIPPHPHPHKPLAFLLCLRILNKNQDRVSQSSTCKGADTGWVGPDMYTTLSFCLGKEYLNSKWATWPWKGCMQMKGSEV